MPATLVGSFGYASSLRLASNSTPASTLSSTLSLRNNAPVTYEPFSKVTMPPPDLEQRSTARWIEEVESDSPSAFAPTSLAENVRERRGVRRAPTRVTHRGSE